MSLLSNSAAMRSRLRLLTHTLTVWREGVQIASARGRIVPVGAEGGAYAPVALAPEGLGGQRSSHLGMQEGAVNVRNGDEIHDGNQTYFVLGATPWEGLTATALSQVERG